ncbi:SEC-C metal-binding domain-containing protein [Paenibacillus sp. GCM10023252]|uniref:SEC-C metal-binding domain-containing protein n=1 Tax=Paenibacillus sp. GCM10023252 TaxID=3252649 RepID=UPI003608D977
MNEAMEVINKQELRRQQKLWGSIDVPLKLPHALSRLTRDELLDLSRRLNIDKVSSLKKQELIAALSERMPGALEKHLSKVTQDVFGPMLQVVRMDGQASPDKLDEWRAESMRSLGLIYSGTVNGKRMLIMPVELLAVCRNPALPSSLRSVLARNTEWMKLTSGLLFYYGMLSIEDMIRRVGQLESSGLFHPQAYMEVLEEYVRNGYDLYYGEGAVYHRSLVDVEGLEQELKLRSNVNYYPYTKEQLLKAGDSEFVDRNPVYHAFVSLLVGEFKLSREDAELLSSESAAAIRRGHSMQEIIDYLQQEVQWNSYEALNRLMTVLVPLMNQTKQWCLKGYSSSELSAKLAKPAPLMQSSTVADISEARPKVGRNDPCPCGSGKKYKKCCG